MMADEVVQVREMYPRVVPESPGEAAGLSKVQEPVLGPPTRPCNRCGTPIVVPYPKDLTRGLRVCRPCQIDRVTRKNREKGPQYFQAYYDRLKTERPEQYREVILRGKRYKKAQIERWRLEDPVRYDAWRLYHAEYMARCDPEKKREWQNRNKFKTYQKALELLGAKCVMCGTTDLRVLTIDHINGGGNHDPLYRKGSLYRAIVLGQRSIKGLQCLCFNCNCGVKRRKWMEPFLKGK